MFELSATGWLGDGSVRTESSRCALIDGRSPLDILRDASKRGRMSKPGFRSVSEQISEVRGSHPQSIALNYGDRQVTYEELDRRANRFAGRLVRLGILPGATAVLCMERSFDWTVAALGIMRAGAAYVPLDSAWPDSRLRFAVEDSRATCLVARETLLNRLHCKVCAIDPGRDAAVIATSSESCVSLEPQSLAYVIYTSGSTGVPKGVEITHSNLAHLIRWHRDAFSVERQDRAAHLAGLGFDAAVWEIWPTLCAGATLCFADDTVRLSPESIQQWMVNERVTIGFVPAVLARPMMSMEWPARTALRLLLTGGDALRQGPPVGLPFEVINNYGPTECTVVATSSVLKPGSSRIPPIGRPIAGASVYLLDEDGKLVPDRTIGEIYISGDGVGRGYRNLPDMTKRSFLSDPFAETPGARMYRTGDRGIRQPDGEIEFRGRVDRQTKIYGQRVELDEIGCILAQHPSIDFATAIVNPSGREENRLVAYVLFKENARVPAVKELQTHLLGSLPEHMVPAVFMSLEVLPLSPNGKIDLTMLAQNARLLEAKTPKAPATPTEKRLLTIIRVLLEGDQVGADDNFFLAGGSSLLGMQLLMRLRTSFAVELTLQQLFEASTVERLASLIETKIVEKRLALIWQDLLGRNEVGLDTNFFNLGGHPVLMATLQERIAAEFGQPVPISQLLQSPTIRQQAELTLRISKPEPGVPPGVLSLQPNGSRPAIFWVHYVNVNLAKEFGDDQPIFLITLTAMDFESLEQKPTLENTATCLVNKILATQSKGPYNIGGLCIGSILAYEVASQLRSAGHEVSLLVLLDAPSPSYLKSYNSLTAKLSQPRHLLTRVVRLGTRRTIFNLRRRLIKHFAGSARAKFAWKEIEEAHGLIESAAFSYDPRGYEGKVLLILASERPPHGDFLPGWQSVVTHDLHTSYVQGHHRELMTTQNVRSIADLIASHLLSANDNTPVPVACCPRPSKLAQIGS